MNYTIRSVFAIISTLMVSSVGAVPFGQITRYVKPEMVQKTLRAYPMLFKVADSTIDSHFEIQTQPESHGFTMAKQYGATAYHVLSPSYKVAKNLLFYKYLSSQPQKLYSKSILPLLQSVLYTGANYNVISSNTASNLTTILPWLVSTDDEGMLSLFAWKNISANAFNFLSSSSNFSSTGDSVGINLACYAANAYIKHFASSRDNSTWTNFGKNLGLAFIGHQMINAISGYAYDWYYKTHGLDIIAEDILDLTMGNMSKFPDKISELSLDEKLKNLCRIKQYSDYKKSFVKEVIKLKKPTLKQKIINFYNEYFYNKLLLTKANLLHQEEEINQRNKAGVSTAEDLMLKTKIKNFYTKHLSQEKIHLTKKLETLWNQKEIKDKLDSEILDEKNKHNKIYRTNFMNDIKIHLEVK